MDLVPLAEFSPIGIVFPYASSFLADGRGDSGFGDWSVGILLQEGIYFRVTGAGGGEIGGWLEVFPARGEEKGRQDQENHPGERTYFPSAFL
jgi:hypothetical protein